jgi:N-acetylglucosamine kinase-like BadF-type ATPase
MAGSRLAVGVDGGGTKTLGVLSDAEGNILARVHARGSNPIVVGIEQAGDLLAELIRRCCDEAGRLIEDVGCVVLGLAGAGSEVERSRLGTAMHSRLDRPGAPPFPLIIDTDLRVALEGAFEGGPGVVVIAGTGSSVMGKSENGSLLRTGGWGRTLEDEGSGYHIGLLALKAVAGEIDGLGSAGSLREMLAAQFGLENREAIIKFVYRERLDLASLAPVVLDAAEYDDAAKELLRGAASPLARQIFGMIKQLNLGDQAQIAMIGSLIDHDTPYARILTEQVRALSPCVDIRSPVRPPAEGALLMALARLKKG